MYNPPPQFRPGPHGDIVVSEREMDDAFEEFYIDTFVEFSKFGAIEEFNVCDNPGAHLTGNVYLKYASETQAADALKQLQGRIYDGKPMRGELCTVTNFNEARCRQYSGGMCDHKMCNFLHLKEPAQRLSEKLYRWQLEEWKKNGRPYEPAPPAYPPPKDRGYGRRGDRFNDRRDGGHRRDDRRGGGRWEDDRRGGGRWGDDRGPYRRPSSPGRHRNGDYDDYGARGPQGDPFGRDMRGAQDSSEREIEERLAQVRSALASQQGDHSKKRERPESGFDQDFPERNTKIPKLEQ